MRLASVLASRINKLLPQKAASPSRLKPRSVRPHLQELEDRDVASAALLGGFGGLAGLDGHAAVGPNHVVEAVDGKIAVYAKTGGTPLLSQPLGTSETSTPFFAPLDPGSRVVAPLVAYDELAGRFVVAALDVEQSTYLNGTPADRVEGLLYAVSNTSNPLDGFTEMHRITFGPNQWIDSMPRVGWNADAHVFTLPLYTPPPGSDDPDLVLDYGVRVVRIDKSTVLDRSTATFAAFESNRDDVDDLAPAAMHGAQPGDPMWLVHLGPLNSGNTIVVERVDGVLAPEPTVTATPVPVDPFFVPTLAREKDGVGTIDAGDASIANAEWRDGRLVATHTVVTDPVMLESLGAEDHVRWYEFGTAGPLPTLTQQGTLDQGPGVHTYMPSVAVAPNGDIGLTYLESSANEYVSMYVTGRTAADPLGTMRAPALAQAGVARLYGTIGSAIPVGRHSAVTVDPLDGTFWAVNAYAMTLPTYGGANRGTWVAHFAAEAPPHIDALTANPDPVLQGGQLTLTAAGVTGSAVRVAFYRDADGNGTLEPGIDTLLGADTTGGDGWGLTITIPPNLPTGTYRYFAQADGDGLLSNVVTTTNRVGKATGGGRSNSGGPKKLAAQSSDPAPAASTSPSGDGSGSNSQPAPSSVTLLFLAPEADDDPFAPISVE